MKGGQAIVRYEGARQAVWIGRQPHREAPAAELVGLLAKLTCSHSGSVAMSIKSSSTANMTVVSRRRCPTGWKDRSATTSARYTDPQGVDTEQQFNRVTGGTTSSITMLHGTLDKRRSG
jgi:hypothetical protein